jgi:four helix bundle protein
MARSGAVRADGPGAAGSSVGGHEHRRGLETDTRGDFARFLNVAEGSLAEVGYLLLLGRDLGSRGAAEADRLRTEVEEISRMAYGLRRKVEETA